MAVLPPPAIAARSAFAVLLRHFRSVVFCALPLALAVPLHAAAEDLVSTDPLIVSAEADRTRYYRAASYEEAIDASLRGFARAVELGSRRDQVLFLRHLTFDNWLLGNLEFALSHGHELLELTEELDLPADRSRAHRYLSQINLSLDDVERSTSHARAALELADRLGDGSLIAFARQCLGLCALRSLDFPVARRELAAAFAHFRAANQPVNTLVVRREQGDLAIAEGDLAGALAIYNEVEALSHAANNPLSVARALHRMAPPLRRLGRPAEALERLERARPFVERVGGHSLRRDYFTELALTHEALGQPAAALAAERTAHAAREAMATAQARARAAEANSRRELAQKERTIARLNAERLTQEAELRARDAELRRHRTVRTALAIGAGVVALAAGVIVLALRSRLRARRLALEETRRAQIVAEDAGVLKMRLLAIASHDLKGPLRSVLRSADVLERHAHDPAAVAESARLLRGQARGMFDLVRDLLDLAAIEGGDLQLQRAPLDLRLIADETVHRHTARATDKEQTLSCETPAEPLLLSGDAARLAQAVDNLVDNAIKFTPLGGTVRVVASRSGEHVCLAVTDTGPGLGPDDLARLFQPFQRLNPQPTGGESSTGIGLHITRDFVVRHGGDVEIDTTPGQGATFRIVLPALRPA